MGFDNLSGQVLGSYELRELLGQGGMGAVYRAIQTSLKREVAIKILPAALASQQDYLERFDREASISAGLQHPHIVPIIDYGTVHGISYVVMRLLTGGNLAQRVSQRLREGGSMPSLGEIAQMLKQIASALDYAHSQHVIHRDIKASNIMFDNQGYAYLVDFGIAKLLDATNGLTTTGVTVGTSAYMPPEQWRAETLTPATDQYALAIVIYLLICGRMPFEADTPHGLMYKHLNEMPTPPQTFRADVANVVTTVLERALSKNPADRFPSVTDFAEAYERAITGGAGKSTGFFTAKVLNQPSPAATPPITPNSPRIGAGFTPPPLTPTILQPTPLPNGSRRNNWTIWGLGVVIVGIVVIIALLIANMTRQPSLALLPTSTPSETTLPTSTASDTPTLTSSPTGTATGTFTLMPSATLTVAPVLTDTLIPSAMPTFTPTATDTTSPTFTFTPAPTNTPSPTATDQPSATPSATATDLPTNTPLPTATAVPPSLTPLPTFTLTYTATITATFTLTATSTNTTIPSATSTELPPAKASITINSSVANLRTGPGTSFGVLTTANNGDTFDVIATNDKQSDLWYLVDLGNGTPAWVAAKVVDLDSKGVEILVAATIPAPPVIVSNPPQNSSNTSNSTSSGNNNLTEVVFVQETCNGEPMDKGTYNPLTPVAPNACVTVGMHGFILGRNQYDQNTFDILVTIDNVRYRLYQIPISKFNPL